MAEPALCQPRPLLHGPGGAAVGWPWHPLPCRLLGWSSAAPAALVVKGGAGGTSPWMANTPDIRLLCQSHQTTPASRAAAGPHRPANRHLYGRQLLPRGHLFGCCGSLGDSAALFPTLTDYGKLILKEQPAPPALPLQRCTQPPRLQQEGRAWPPPAPAPSYPRLEQLPRFRAAVQH